MSTDWLGDQPQYEGKVRRRCHSGPDILCVAGPSLTCSVVLVIRVRAVKAGFSAEPGFTSVGAGPGPQGCPRAAVLKAQDGRPLPQTRSIRDGLGAWEILSHLTDPHHCTDEKNGGSERTRNPLRVT